MTTAKKTPAKKETVKKTAVKAAAKTVKAAKPAAKKAAVKAPKTTAKVAVKKAADKKSTEKKPAEKKVAYTESVSNAAKILFELRAQKLQLIDLRGISETADFMIIATCESEAQMQAILTELSKTFKHQGLPHRTEYKPGINMRWAVFDAGFDLMVQLFEESKRKELAFDKLYSDAKVTDLDEKNFVKKATKKAKADDELI